MQRVAAYVLERAGLPQSPQAGKKEGNQIRAVVETWLKSKGSTSSDGSGGYAATQGSRAN